jgi:SapC
MLELLNNVSHKDLRVITQRGTRWGDDVMSCPVTPDEFRSLQAHYPILFQPDGSGGFMPVALFGLQEGQNLFLDDAGWDAAYLPLAMRRMPFSIGVEGHELRMMVDMASPRIVTGAEGEAVFLPQGGHSDLLETANSVLRTLHEVYRPHRTSSRPWLATSYWSPLFSTSSGRMHRAANWSAIQSSTKNGSRPWMRPPSACCTRPTTSSRSTWRWLRCLTWRR